MKSETRSGRPSASKARRIVIENRRLNIPGNRCRRSDQHRINFFHFSWEFTLAVSSFPSCCWTSNWSNSTWNWKSPRICYDGQRTRHNLWGLSSLVMRQWDMGFGYDLETVSILAMDSTQISPRPSAENYRERDMISVTRGQYEKSDSGALQYSIVEESLPNVAEPLGMFESGAQAILDVCSRSLKFGFPFHIHSLWSKRVVQIIQLVVVFNAFNVLEPDPEPNTSRCWSRGQRI